VGGIGGVEASDHENEIQVIARCHQIQEGVLALLATNISYIAYTIRLPFYERLFEWYVGWWRKVPSWLITTRIDVHTFPLLQLHRHLSGIANGIEFRVVLRQHSRTVLLQHGGLQQSSYGTNRSRVEVSNPLETHVVHNARRPSRVLGNVAIIPRMDRTQWTCIQCPYRRSLGDNGGQ